MTLRLSTTLSVTVAMASIALTGCGGKRRLENAHPPVSERFLSSVAAASEQTRIVGGKALTADNPGHKSAVAIFSIAPNGKNGSICTGTLVAPGLVVTAAHCMIRNKPIAVLFGTNVNDDKTRVARKVVEFLPFKRTLNQFPSYDIGWVKFEGSVPPGHVPSKILVNPKRLDETPRALLVGYGITSDKGEDSGEKRTVLTRVSKHAYVNNDKFKSVIVMGPTPGFGACQGDSGGPAYVYVNKEWVLTGATNGITPHIAPSMSCHHGSSWYTFVGDYVPWIQSTAKVRLATVQ